MQDPKKKIASIIVGKLKAEDGPVDPREGVDGPSPGLMAAASKMISAVKGGDAKELAMALKDFSFMHEQEEQASELPSEEGEPSGEME